MDDIKEGSLGLPKLPAAMAAASLLAACGGGSGDTSGGGSDGGSTLPVSPTPVEPIGNSQAARFLAQASMGATHELMARVQAVGYSKWIDEQMAMPASQTRWDWLMAKGFNAIENKNGQNGIDAALWFKLIASPDTLRQRITLAQGIGKSWSPRWTALPAPGAPLPVPPTWTSWKLTPSATSARCCSRSPCRLRWAST
jgi:hypothetical protein